MTKDRLQIANQLALPIDAATQTFAFLGKRGGGKTYAAMKLAELMLDVGIQVVAFDPVGKWYGLRIPGEGRNAKGYDIPVFGGLNGDLPLQSHAGALIADLIVERNLSAVIDVSQFILSEQTRFMLDFIQQFFQRKKSQSSPVHLFIEECQEFIPQQIGKSEAYAARLLHHFERTVKLGRNFGIGASMISQRPQEVNKKVLNQTEVLFVFQMTGLQERKTIEEWTRTKGIEISVKDELPTLAQGVARVWSPSWLFVNDLFKVLPKRSADVSATPTATSFNVETKPLTKVDVDKLKEAMQVIVEEADRKDPVKLHKQIRELEKQLAVAQKQEAPATKIETVEVPVISDEQIKEMWEFSRGLFKAIDNLTKLMTDFDNRLVKVEEARKVNAQKLKQQTYSGGITSRMASEPEGQEIFIPQEKSFGKILSRSIDKTKVPINKPKKVDSNLTQPQQRILNALAAFENLGMSPVKRINVAFFAGYTENGHFNNSVGSLRNQLGLIDYPAGGMLALTDAGRALAQPDDNPIVTLSDLHQTWLDKLKMPEQKILTVLIEIYPESISRRELAARTGYTENGHFNNTVGHLRTLGVAYYPQGSYVAATDVLFPEGLF